MQERHNEILEMVGELRRVEVARLAILLDVSQVTIRKDLDLLEKRGLLKREHGYAVAVESGVANDPMILYYETKRRIASVAAQLVEDGEVVMMEAGSCCAFLAEELFLQKTDITIVTNSVFLAEYVPQKEGVQVILLGGAYHSDSKILTGPLTRKGLETFFVDKLFVGTEGFSFEAGFLGTNYVRAEIVQDMATKADRVIVLTESETLSRRSSVPLLSVEDVDTLITDDGIPEEIETYFLDHIVDVYKVLAE